MSRNPHHANLLIGTPEEAESYVRTLAEGLGIRLANNPDFFVFKADTFGIDEAREISLLSARKALTPNTENVIGKIFLIIPTRLTLEAQNALLKTFEDPSPGTCFFLTMREESLVLPTLRSRMETFRLSVERVSQSEDAETFLSSSIKDRLLFAKSFMDEEKNLSGFLDDLLLLLRRQHGQERLVESVYNVRRLVHDSTVTPRLVIEHLSLVL